jgi:3-hydroxybutyryl-CoA dehydrogenase
VTAYPAAMFVRSLIGVVGAGTMGAGIAQLALEAGHEVVLHDVDDIALDHGRDRIADGLLRRALKADDSSDADRWVDERLARLRQTEVLEQVADAADVVIEAALESLDLKRTIFRTLGAVADPAAILATNTSALSVAQIAGATTHPERVLGLHFFNPAPVMRLVEVVATEMTTPNVIEAASALVESWGRTAVRSADRPGFIVNRVNRPFTIEALRILEAGEASIEQIDDAIRQGGFPLGPFELMDLTGLDITTAAATAIWEGLGRPAHLRPSPIQLELVEAGRLGRKTGEGFYHYEEGRRGRVADRFAASPTSLSAAAIRDRIERAIRAEAERVVGEGVASAADVDVALRLGAAHPRGPFESET